jgi:hypothetical protein
MRRQNTVKLIEGSPKATAEIDAYAQVFSKAMRELYGLPHDGLAETLTISIADFISNTIEWTADRWGHKDYVKPSGQEDLPPSKIRIKLIKELDDHASFFAEKSKKPVEFRKRFSKAAIEALRGEGVLGLGLLSLARRHDLDTKVKKQIDHIGLGGQSEVRKKGLVFGFDDPGVFTKQLGANARMLSRKIARSSKKGGTGMVRADIVGWRLSDVVDRALLSAPKYKGYKEDTDLAALQEMLDEAARKNLSFCCQQAARLLEINFHITKRKAADTQSSESIESWLYTPPLYRFIVSIFEVVAPTRDGFGAGDGRPWRLDDVKISHLQAAPQRGKGMAVDVLGKNAKVLASEGIACSRRVARAILPKERLNLDVDAGLLEITEDIGKNIKPTAVINRPPTKSELEEKADDAVYRRGVARDRIVSRVWALRQDWLITRGYSVFFGWYEHLLFKHVFDRHHDLFFKFERKIYRPMEQCAIELGSRFQAAAVYPRNMKRRADDLPLSIFHIPARFVSRHMDLVEYPGEKDCGARPNLDVIQAFLTAIARRDPNVRKIWKRVTTLVPFEKFLPRENSSSTFHSRTPLLLPNELKDGSKRGLKAACSAGPRTQKSSRKSR